MKKFVSGVFTILFVCLISFGVRAQVYSGQCGDYCSEVSWKYDTETETLEISGKGRTVDYPDADAPWHEYGYVSNLIVGEGITYLGESLLYLGNGSFHILDKVVLPSTLDDAGAQVLYSEISELHITDAGTLMRIPDSSVVNSTDREKDTYTVHGDSTEICTYAFYRCSGVSEIIIPDTVVSIGAYAFSDCVSLTYADLPKGLSQMGDGIFSGNEMLFYCVDDDTAETFLLASGDGKVGTEDLNILLELIREKNGDVTA